MILLKIGIIISQFCPLLQEKTCELQKDINQAKNIHNTDGNPIETMENLLVKNIKEDKTIKNLNDKIENFKTIEQVIIPMVKKDDRDKKCTQINKIADTAQLAKNSLWQSFKEAFVGQTFKDTNENIMNLKKYYSCA